MKRILITGKEGQIGWELQRTLAALGKIWAYNRQELDLENPDAICKTIREVKPHLIVNAAAYTAVDQAEVEQEKAHRINSIAPAILASEAKTCGAIFIHYSTDYVFDGTSNKPYQEDDFTKPLNIYGKTKLQGELAVKAALAKHLILRTSWVYGTRGKNFLLTMLRLGKEKELLKIVGDQLGSPSWSRLIAEITAQMASKAFSIQEHKDIWGTYHLTSAGQTSWFGFAEEIFRIQKESLTNQKKEGLIPKLQEITTSEYLVPAKRPKYSVLSNEKISNTFQLHMPDWKKALRLCMESQT